ncbi:MAG TPA: L-histidine N(alpha)-methyltransferase [Candidatus Angelobacter sp.]|nr:L-histidine N(alpha)-methyltransferase [Candidatus Angelobacter sp.]
MTASRSAPVLTSTIAEDVLLGLSAEPMRLPAKLFYDAAGSRLFEEITRTPEYYPTRTERAILEDHAAEIARAAGTNLTVVELGAGSASKTRVLISAILRRQLRLEFHPVDVSPAALKEALSSLNGDFTNLKVSPIVADYTDHVPRLDSLPGRKLVLFIGSTIGNFEPQQAVRFLQRVRRSLQPGDALLIGFDMVKDAQVLHAAYNDAAGVTAQFNKNLLARINRELDADFDLDEFNHVAFWNQRASRIEMHLESRVDQSVRVRDLNRTFHFSFGERIHTENSYKFTTSSIRRLVRLSGFKMEQTWTDPQRWFSVVLARA